LRAIAEDTVRRLRQLEASRLDQVQRKFTEITRASALSWRHILRSVPLSLFVWIGVMLMPCQVTNERGAWGVEQMVGQRWKLDKTEDVSRRRMRLRRNYDFDPHTGCAANSHDDPHGTSLLLFFSRSVSLSVWLTQE
jgi:hypothetical protein